jgi:hypothetical protein
MGLKTVDQLVICLGQRRDFNRPLDIIPLTIQHWQPMGKFYYRKLIYVSQSSQQNIQIKAENGLLPVKGVDNRKIAIYHVIVCVIFLLQFLENIAAATTVEKRGRSSHELFSSEPFRALPKRKKTLHPSHPSVNHIRSAQFFTELFSFSFSNVGYFPSMSYSQVVIT